jgi:fermentation-respiration switch protein FrsA (DUF1100 family)
VTGPGSDVSLHASDGVALHARYLEHPGATLTLLYLHGNAGNLANRSDLLQQLSALGVHVLAIDYRGYGQSAGRPSEAGVYRDAAAAYAWATARTPAAKLVLLGESLGGGLACELAATRPIGGLILASTFTSIPDMAALHFPGLPLRWLLTTRFDNLTKIARVRAPTLFLHSRSDEIVPWSMGERLFAAAAEPKRALWLDHAGHNDTFYSPETGRVQRELRAFLQDLTTPR